MIKISLLLLLLSTQIFAQGNIKIKAKQTNNIVKVNVVTASHTDCYGNYVL